MRTARENLTVLRYAALSGFQDFASIYPPGAWVFGWFLRVVSQVLFFGLIGRFVGAEALVEFLIVGMAVLIAAGSSLTASVSTTWERTTGTLPLLVASPSSPLVVLTGRSLQWIPNGVASAIGSLLIAGPLFGVEIPPVRFLGVTVLILLVTASSYMLGLWLGALVLRLPAIRRVVANLARLVLMAFCGVTVSIDYYPELVQWVVAVLPLTHGLTAIRELLAGADGTVILRGAALEMAVGAGWLLMALFAFDRLADAGRRDGSIVFTS